MDQPLDLVAVENFGTALLIGALIGIEREKRKNEDQDISGSGLRTFILVAEVGAVAGWLSRILFMPWLLVAALLAVAACVLSAYVLGARVQPHALGLTTEIAAITVCLLGAMVTFGHRDLAIGLAVITAAVLAYKHPLHSFLDKLGWDDVFAGLRLMIATFVILPLLPDRPIDPWQALNPYSLWLLVLLISSLSLVGYVATRWLGAGRGTMLTGLTGGLVSSTAVTLSFARQSRADRRSGAPMALICGILIAWCIMFGRVIAMVLVVNRALVAELLIPFIAMGCVAGGMAWMFYRRGAASQRGIPSTGDLPLKNPFSLTEASKFAAFFALVLLVMKIVQLYYPGEGVYIVAALAGLTDVDAITLSMAGYARAGDADVAVHAIVIASLSNTLTKCVMTAALGAPALRFPILIATAGIFLAGLGTIMMF